jgi:hypothetical protein
MFVCSTTKKQNAYIVELYIFSSEKEERNLINYADGSIHPGRYISSATELMELMILLINKTNQVLAATNKRRQHALRKQGRTITETKWSWQHLISTLTSVAAASKTKNIKGAHSWYIYSSIQERKAMYQG